MIVDCTWVMEDGGYIEGSKMVFTAMHVYRLTKKHVC